jgi:hypothetical protein
MDSGTLSYAVAGVPIGVLCSNLKGMKLTPVFYLSGVGRGRVTLMGARVSSASAPPVLVSLPPAIDAARCGRAVGVAADGRTATAGRDGDARHGTTRVDLALEAVSEGIMEVDFYVNRGYAAFGIRGRGGSARNFRADDVCTQWTFNTECYIWGVRERRAPFRQVCGGGGELVTMRVDLGAGTLSYDVAGTPVGTLAANLKGRAVMPVFFLSGDGESSITVTGLRVSGSSSASSGGSGGRRRGRRGELFDNGCGWPHVISGVSQLRSRRTSCVVASGPCCGW